jgi:hypothetical protein
VLSTNDGPKSWVAERGVKLPSGIHAEGEAESGERRAGVAEFRRIYDQGGSAALRRGPAPRRLCLAGPPAHAGPAHALAT